MNENITVLFTAVCGWPTHATVGALRKSEKYKYTVVGVDCNPNVAAMNYVDFLYKVPRCDSPEYIAELLRICNEHSVDIIVPLISEDIAPLTENRHLFEEKGIRILLSGRDSKLLIANDKEKLAEFLEENGIDVMPKTKKLSLDTLDEDLKALGYPEKRVALKLKDGCGAVGFKVIDDEMATQMNKMNSREFRANPYVSKQQVIEIAKGDAQKHRYLLQEYVPGRELGVVSLVDHGRTVYALTHDNYDMQYATTVDCELIRHEEAENIVRMLNEMLGLNGNIGYDFKRDEDGKVRLLEINPRISATVSLAVKAGVNIVEMGILNELGKPIDEDIVPMYGMRMMRVYGTLYSYKGEPYGDK